MTSPRLDRESGVPLYQQLEGELTRRIQAMEWRPGQRIPSENELHRVYGLSRMTVRNVVTKLVNDGLVRRVPGKGTFVTEDKIAALSPAYLGIREQLEAMGLALTTHLVSLNQIEAPPEVRKALQLSDRDGVHAIVRMRAVDGSPISLHRSYVPTLMAPGLENFDLVTEQLCVVLDESFGIRMSRAEEELEAVPSIGQDATELKTEPGAAVLALRDVLFDQHGRPFEYSHITFRGDRMRLKFEYAR